MIYKTLNEPLTTFQNQPSSSIFIIKFLKWWSKLRWIVFKRGGIPPPTPLLKPSSLGAGDTSVPRGVADAACTGSLGSGGFVSGDSSRYPSHLSPSVSTTVTRATKGT